MKRGILYGLILFSFIFNIVFIIHLVGMGNSGDEGVSLLEKDLKLTDTQKEEIRTKCTPLMNENREFEKILAEKRAKLLTLVKGKEINMEEISSCIDEINEIQKKIQVNVVKQLIIYKDHMNREQCSCFMKDIGKEMDVNHVCDENCQCSEH